MNTEIEYLYRDASNYKQGQSEIVAGEMTDEQKQTVLSSLNEGLWFIPYQVGLKEERCGYDITEDDHIWFELYSEGISYTDAFPTVDMTAEQLASAFASRAGNWDVADADMRLA